VPPTPGIVQMRKLFRTIASLRFMLILGMFLQTPLVNAAAASDHYDPVADSRAVVLAGSARFTVLTPQLIRLEWAKDGKFEDHASFAFLNRALPVPQFTRQIGPRNRVVLKTNALTLVYDPGDTDGKFTPSDLSVSFSLNGKEVVWKPGISDTGNLLGTTRTLDTVRGEVKLEPGLISRDGWTLVDDSARPLFDSADFGFRAGEQSPWPWVMLRPAGERQDWYFFGYGHDYKGALHDFTRVAGKIPLPPRFAFGAWWSRYWSYSDQEFEQLLQQFRTHDIPLSVLVMDIDWHPTFNEVVGNDKQDASGHRLGWTGYSWNKLLFPDPAGFLSSVHEQGLKTTLNIHPASGIQPWEDSYPAMARSMGIDPASKQYVPFSITDRKFADNYLKYVIHPLEHQGIDFFWLDWQQEDATKLAGVNPTWWLNYVFFTDQEREKKRPLLFHRWGGLGNHRYQIGFSGDTISVWDSLAFQPYFTATAANVGYSYWSHDIGGHQPGEIEPELYLRWIEWGIFSPILRTHTTKNPEAERRIWAYPEPYSDLMRQCFVRRDEMQPYIYTEARKTHDTGIGFLHPLYYDWPEAPEAYDAKNEYMFGDSILADPITQPVAKDSQLAKAAVWLPPGDWFEWDTGARLEGPATLERSFSLSQIPVYVKAGSIIPMQPATNFPITSTAPLVLSVFPMNNGQVSTYRLYEDAGDTPGYESGENAWTPIRASLNSDGTLLDISVAPVEGHYPGMPTERAYELRLPGSWPPSAVSVNGEPLRFAERKRTIGWRFNGDTLTTIVTTPRVSLNSTLKISLRIGLDMARNRSLLDGFAGKLARLRETYDLLNANWPVAWSPDELVSAMQTGDRIGYFPKTALDEIGGLQKKLSALPELIDAMHATKSSPGFATTATSESSSDHPQEKLVHYNSVINTALAHIAGLSETQPPASREVRTAAEP
jgi:alpha-glucosidase (family GH31 glycosyl hydrolase)